MRQLRWQLLIVIFAVVAIAVLLIGQQPETPTVITAPATGGIYTEAIVGTIRRLNPILDTFNPTDRDIDRLIFSRLFRFDDRGLPQLDLAESRGVSLEGTIYNVSLRQNAYWHDGEQVTTDDVIYTIDLMREQGMPILDDVQRLWTSVDVRKLDDFTIQFRLEEPFAPFLDYLTFGILPEHLLSHLAPEDIIDDTFNFSPVGSGPYIFDRLLIDDGKITGVVLIANEAYYLGRPFIDQVIFRLYENPEDALDAYTQGEVLGLHQITPDILRRALLESNLNAYTSRLPNLTMIFMNLDNPEVPFFQDVNVRKALLMAINRQWIIDRLLLGQGIVAHSPILPGTWAHYEGSSIDKIGFDPERAVDILREVGYRYPAEGGDIREKDGVLLAFELVYPDDTLYALIAQSVQANLGDIGVQVTIIATDYQDLKDNYLTPRFYEAALVDLELGRTPDPDPYPFWHQTQITGGQNYSKWDDRLASEYLEQARIAVEFTERERLYRNFQVHFSREVPALLLFFPVYNYAVDNQIQGVSIGPIFEPSDRLASLPEWFLVARRELEPLETPTQIP